MNLESAIYLGVAGLVMAAASFALGRRTGGSARELELDAELSTAKSEQARSEAEAERLRNELDAGRQEYDEYRLSVVDHFSGTSDLLRDLTGQYRSVYEHLTKGASMLCPEGFVGLTDGLPLPQLAESQPDLELEEVLETAVRDTDSGTSTGTAAPDSDRGEIVDLETDSSSASALDRSEHDDTDDPEKLHNPEDPDSVTAEIDPEETLGVPAVSV